MSTEENKAIARRWHEEVFNNRNFSAIDELLDPAYVNYSAHIRGLSAAKEQFTKMISNTPDLHLVTEDVIAEGDKVVLRWTWQEGGKTTASGVTILRITGRKIVEDWFYGGETPAV